MKRDTEFDADPIADAAMAMFGDRLGRARVYRDALADAGVTRGLIGPREVDRLWSRHILNCAVVADALPRRCSVIDVGSGAGLPGIPIAMANPDLTVTLIEPLERRVDFLLEIVAELALDVTVVHGRAEAHDIRDAYEADVVTSRAVAPLDRLARWCVPMIRIGGEMVAIKGTSAQQEIATHASAIRARGLVAVKAETVGADRLDTPTTIVRAERSASARRTRRGGGGSSGSTR